MRRILALAAVLLAAGCATTANDPRDPWEAFNRASFDFNDGFDRAILKPVAQGYEKVTPAFVREGVNDFFSNLEDVGVALNNLLQGKIAEGASDVGRVVVNSVFGVFGLWDVATPLGLEKHDEDFGQTLGRWGVPSGPYLVIPFLGPSSARDAPAKVVDPQWYWPRLIHNDTAYWTLWTFDKVRTRANLLKAGTILDEAAIDRYAFVRDAWLQRRRSQVYDGHPPRLEEDEDQ